MKHIFKISLLFISIICCSITGYSQEWYKMINQEPVNVEKVKQSAEKYFDDIGRGKHTGYKQYQRWLSNATRNMDKNGELYTNNHIAAELKKFRVNSGNKKQTATTTIELKASIATTDANGNWTPMGPFYAEGDVEGKRLGKLPALAVEAVNQQLLFVGSQGGGLWRSTDAGASWEPLGDNFDNMFPIAIAIDPHNINHVLYLNDNSEIFESLDQGDTWNQILNLNRANVNAKKMIKFHPTQPNIYFVTARELMKTTDGGATFTSVLDSDNEDVFFKPGDPTTMYSVGDDFWKSTDSGETWNKITNGIDRSVRMKMTVTPADPNRVYILQKDDGSGGFGRIYKSTNSGTSFTIMADSDNGATNYFSSLGASKMGIMCSTTDPDKLHMGGVNHFRSDDGGATIYEVPNSQSYYSSTYIHADILVMNNVNGTLYAATDGGIFRSTDGGDNYTALTGGLMVTQVYRMGSTAPYPDTGAGLDPDMVVVGAQDNGTQISKGTDHDWEQWLSSDGMECFIDYTNDDNVFGSKQNGVLMYSTDGGNTFRVLKEDEFGNWTTPFEMDPITPTTLYSGYSELYRSTNSGEDWEAITSGQTDGALLSEIAIAPSDNNYIYFAQREQVWVSTNAQSSSRTWTEASGINGIVNYITVDPNDPSHALIANTGSEIYETKDAGTTWTEISGNLPDVAIESVLMDNSAENTIYAGMFQSVYYKDDTMTDWEIFGNDLPRCRVRELEINYQANKLRVCTYGRGVWEIPVNNLTSIVYCDSKGENVSDEWIDRIEFGSIDNTSGVNGGYADFSATHSTTLTPGTSETITITPAWSSTVYNEGYAVWIDFNKDGDFSDSGELVYTQAVTKSTPVSGTITIPVGTSAITTTMRVSMQYNNVPDSCGTLNYGEVEDYTIVIGGIIDTSIPTGYCDSNGATSNYEWIDLVQLGSINNVSGNDGGYEDYTAMSTDLAVGNQYTISFSTGFNSTAYTEYWYIFIDYNRDGDFSDAGEQVATGSSSLATTLTADFTVPSGVSLGTTRMRVKMTDGASTDSCETDFSYGEVEDYAINLSATSLIQKDVLSNTTTAISQELGSEEAVDIIYPNPTDDFLNLKLEDSEGIVIKITTATGQVVRQGLLDDKNRIDVRKLTSGVYFLKVNDGQKERTYKFVKR